MSQWTFKRLSSEEVSRAHDLEESGYPASEAASLQTLIQRQSLAPNLFYGTFHHDEMIGFIVGTATSSDALTHVSMADHSEVGRNVAIHSVCVAKDWQRKGVATFMLKKYCERLKEEKYTMLLLISHEEYIKLYENAGFGLLGLSNIVHGPRPWYAMQKYCT